MARLPDPIPELSPSARKVYEAMVAKRGRIDGMYGAMFNHPALVEQVGRLGTYLRFESSLPGAIRELTILLTARRQSVAYEWVKHVPPAKAAGLSEEIIAAVEQRKDLGPYSPLYAKISQVVDLVLAEQSLPQDLQYQLSKEFGIPGAIELVILVGFYRMIAGFIRAFDVPLPPDSASPF